MVEILGVYAAPFANDAVAGHPSFDTPPKTWGFDGKRPSA